MKQILLSLLAGLALSSCTTRGAAPAPLQPFDNYVVLLDLSDRLVHPHQTDIDTSVIRACFEKFEASVRKHLVVKSRDRFSVRIISQQGSPLPADSIENSLSLDLGSIQASGKLKKLREFQAQLGSGLRELYRRAYRGPQTGAYPGVDIWQYFNEQLPTDLDPAASNRVVVLTDGYFDFEDRSRGLLHGRQSTVSRHLLSRMKGFDWRAGAEKEGIGLIPVRLQGNTRFCIAGIRAKNADLLETEKLSYLWENWVQRSGGTLVTPPLANASSGKMKNLVKATL